jgi:hypothetical protein
VSPVPDSPKLYHIVHVDRLASILENGELYSDAEVSRRSLRGTNIGMDEIKLRRMKENQLQSHPGLYVGDCVPFYFCPRSVMLFVIHKANHSSLAYRGGQTPIVHLVSDVHRVVAWASQHERRWAFTNRNAGSKVYDDWSTLDALGNLEWNAIRTNDWRQRQEGKQAEFLLEYSLPWHLVEEVGVINNGIGSQVEVAMVGSDHRPRVQVRPDWYY